MDGYFLPEGTVSSTDYNETCALKLICLQEVGAQSYSSHLDERIFPEPHVVNPLRWVKLDQTTGQYVDREDITPAMNANFFPFSVFLLFLLR